MRDVERRGKIHIDPEYRIAHVHCDDAMLWLTLQDGRVVGAPLAWFPRLQQATSAQRAQYELWPGGDAIHWPAVDEDISVRVLMGHPS